MRRHCDRNRKGIVAQHKLVEVGRDQVIMKDLRTRLVKLQIDFPRGNGELIGRLTSKTI